VLVKTDRMAGALQGSPEQKQHHNQRQQKKTPPITAVLMNCIMLPGAFIFSCMPSVLE